LKKKKLRRICSDYILESGLVIFLLDITVDISLALVHTKDSDMIRQYKKDGGRGAKLLKIRIKKFLEYFISDWPYRDNMPKKLSIIFKRFI